MNVITWCGQNRHSRFRTFHVVLFCGSIVKRETKACPFILAVLVYFIAIMPMGKRTRTSKYSYLLLEYYGLNTGILYLNIMQIVF
jgi:hypothetical protein